MNFKRNLLSVALASATLMVISPAFAQDTQSTDTTKTTKSVGTVKVKGIRKAIEAAIDTKQTNTSIVEAISAEDIGKLPDASIADSIARLPGLTAQRERGRAAQVNIRGFNGDFGTTTLNGREQASTGDNRGVEFDQYPSELLSGVVVYKTPNAALVGQGLSGTVDLQTVRPLSFKERVITIGARYDQNKIRDQKETGYRATATYIGQCMDNRVGLMLAVSKMDSPQPGYQNEVWGYTGGPNNTTVLGGGKLYKFDNNHDRKGVAATLQFKPNETWDSVLDVFHSRFDKTEIKTGMEFGTIWGTGVLQPGYTVNSNGTITNAKWTNVHPVIRMDSNPISDKLTSIGWNNKFKLNDLWSLNTDLSMSNVKRDFRVLETYVGVATNGGATTMDMSLDPSGLFYNYVLGAQFNDPSSLVLTDAGGWGQDGYLKDFQVNDKLKSARVNLIRKISEGPISAVDFGVNFTKRTKDKSSTEAKLCLTDCTGGMFGVTRPFPGSIQDFNFGGIGQLGVINANELLASGVYKLISNQHAEIAAKNWSVGEDIATFYVKADIDTNIGEAPLRGNVGFQYVDVKQYSDAYSTFQGNPGGTPIHQSTSYGEFLPSLNLGLEFLPDSYLRFGAARQMARPRMDQLKAGMDVSVCTTACPTFTDPVTGQTISGAYWTGGGGNTQLKPWMADALDLSLEKYFTSPNGNRGYVGVAMFHKKLKSYIYNRDAAFDFSGLPLPTLPAGTPKPTSNIGKINQPMNGEGGSIFGHELTLSLPLDVLWSPLNGFGIIGTYSDTTSSIRPNGPGTSEPLSGLSKYVSNVTAYYERGGFGVRLSRRTRSSFRGETRGFGADYQTVSIAGEVVQDAQVSYNFNDGRLKGLSLYLQVSNIGDEPFSAFNDGDPAGRPEKYFEYGRTTLAGFSYKF